MTPRRVVAVTVWATAWLLAGAAVVMAVGFDLPRRPLPVFLSPAPEQVRESAAVVDVAVALVYGPVAALILARRPHPAGVLLAVFAVGSGLAAFGLQYGLLGERHDLPLRDLVAHTGGWAFVPGTFAMAILPLLVRADPLPPWQRWVVGVSVTSGAAATAMSLTQQQPDGPPNPLAVDVAGYQDALVGAYATLSTLNLGFALVSCVVVARRARRAGPRDRSALWWLVTGHVVLTVSYIAMATPEAFAPPSWLVAFALTAPVVGQVMYPAAIVVVVLRQRLFGVELVVSRVIWWAALSASGLVLYLVGVAVASAVAPLDRDVLLVVVPVAIVAAVRPLGRWLQRRVDALVYGAGADPAALLSGLGDRLGEVESGAAGLEQLCAALRRVLRLGYVGLRRAPDGAVVTESGRRGPGAVVVPLRAGEAVVADLVVRPVGAQRFDVRTRALLDDVAGFVAAAWQLVEVSRELESARDRVVAARAAERRRIRRDLHDLLGPSLTGAGYGLAAVGSMLPGRPEPAAHLLAELGADLRRRVDDVRALAGEMAAPPWDGAAGGGRAEGLDDALGRLGRRLARGGPDVVVDVPADLGARLDAEVQHTLYLVAAEALTNAVRHAGARRVVVSVASERDGVRLVVRDDGRGLDGPLEGAAAGVGLTSMRERVAQHDGRLDVDGGLGGTTVTAWLPPRREAARRVASQSA